MKIRYFVVAFAFTLCLNLELSSQSIFNEKKTVEVNLGVDFWSNYGSVESFSYSRGNFWLLTHWGYVFKIDTLGNILKTISVKQSSFYRINDAIYFDSDTIWVSGDNDWGGKKPRQGLFAVDTLGNELGVTIPLPNFSRTVVPVSSVVKEHKYFWIYESAANTIYKIDRSGNVIIQYPNAWYGCHCPNIALLDGNIYKIGDGRSQFDTWTNVFTVDIETGYVTNDWGWGCADNPWHIGLTIGDNCLWSLQWDSWNGKLIFYKFDIPAPAPVPELPKTQWGDFKIIDWAYCPVTPPSIEGLHGLGYNPVSNTMWFTHGHSAFTSAADKNDKVIPLIKEWGGSDVINFADYWQNSFKIYYDIYARNDSIWVAHKWAGLYPGHVTLFQRMDDSLKILENWDINMDDVAGIACDGKYIYVSGRDSSTSTGDLSNDIRKFNLSGELIAHFHFPDNSVYNFEDLAWYQNSLWATSRYRNPDFLFDGRFEKVDILNIDPDNGSIIKSYETDWFPPDANLRANLASDGESLITIGTVCSEIWDNYENTHCRILKLQLNPTTVGDVQEASKPENFQLYQNYPNPFNPATHIRYALPTSEHIRIHIVDLLGRRVRTLYDGYQQNGLHTILWDGMNDSYQPVASGVYIVRIEAKNTIRTKKVTLIR
ncbi:MAG: T9SS type A sorting domain-containing protein [Candidatus Lokiarchaeota archaeon]|nr:T9SS type A sorting domain-containing protein [Candidatus Lokiarchaeota archaeon]